MLVVSGVDGVVETATGGALSWTLPIPTQEERLDFIRAQMALKPLPQGSDVTAESLAALTATDLRFDTRNLLATTIEVPYEDVNQRLQFQAGVHADLAAQNCPMDVGLR